MKRTLPGVLIASLWLSLTALVLSCSPARPRPGADPHSFAQPDQVVIEHLQLDLNINFERRSIEGRASLHIRNKTGTDRLVLDTADMDIQGASLGEERTPASFQLGDEVDYLGRPLTIEISPETEIVHVEYTTHPAAGALQWVEKHQTAGGRHPFLLTQSESIFARTWVPCQDTPTVRMTYDATVRVPPGLMAVMSAENPTSNSGDGVYTFHMPERIPSYLLALAVGDLEFRELGPRTGVYAAPAVVDRAAWEFADTEKMMRAIEELYGPYRWGRYDIIVLPPSFPYGGMENPRLTFATPTILTGDRSLVSLVAHELAHSWSGNLVTNATWNDFWLNEGFTVYLEKRIMEVVYGRDYSEMLALLGLRRLRDKIEEFGADSPDTHLKQNLAARDPEDAFNDVPYQKGYLFLRVLEENLGREQWDPFLRGYFDKFAFRSMTTERFLDHLQQELLDDRPGLADRIRIRDWVYGPGLPDNCPRIESAALATVDAQLESWKKGTPAAGLETAGWTTHEWLYLIGELPEELTHAQMEDLDHAFGFTETPNAEILVAWLERAIENGYEPAYPALERFLTSQGRLKFLRLLYTKLAKTEDGKQRARGIYAKARAGYHPVSIHAIDEVLDWKAGA